MRNAVVTTRSRRLLIGGAAVVLLLLSSMWVVNQRASAAGPTPAVFIVTGENFPDALGAGPASALARGPILMVRQNSIPGATATELSRLMPDEIFVIGGTAVISASVEQRLTAWAPVTRIAGSNRYETAALLSQSQFPADPAAGMIDTYYAAEGDKNPFTGDGAALTIDLFVTEHSWLLISGQAVFSSTASSDIVACGVSTDTMAPLADKGSWRYPAISPTDPWPTCAAQSRTLVSSGKHTVRLVVTGMAAGTVVDDRNLIVTIVPVVGEAILLSQPSAEPPRPLPDE